MPLTDAQKQAAYRQRKAAKIARMELALRAIVASGADGEHSGDRHAACRSLARQALGDAA